MTIKNLWAVCAALLFLAASCEEDIPDPTSSGSPFVYTGDMYALVSNRPWDASRSAASFSNGVLTIFGSPENGTALQIQLDDTLPGTYVLDSTGVNSAWYFTDSADYISKGRSNATGSITITRYDSQNKVLEGSFDLVLVNSFTGSSITIEDGIFKKVEFGPITPLSNGDTLFLGYSKLGANQGVFYWFANPTSGLMSRRFLYRSPLFRGGKNTCYFPASQEYIAFPDSGNGIIINGRTGAENLVFGTAGSSSPVRILNDYFRYERNNRVGLVRFSPNNGAYQDSITTDTIFPNPFQTTNGSEIYQCNGNLLYVVNPSSRTRQTLSLTPFVICALEYEQSNRLLAVKLEAGVFQLIRITLSGTSSTQTVLASFSGLPGTGFKSFSGTYKANTREFIFVVNGTTEVKGARYKVAQNTLSYISFPEATIEGIEAIY